MKSIAYKQFLRFIESIDDFKETSVPAKGWIRAMRNALGMNGRQLAKRMGVSPSRVQRIEKDELSDALTLRTMRRTAEAMNCVFVYAILPREDLRAIVEVQARKQALAHMRTISHTMGLEAQSLDLDTNKEMLDALIEQLVNEGRSKLWDSE